VALIDGCLRHARIFFNRKDTGLEEVGRGSFRPKPPDGMLSPLRQDYEAMATMILCAIPSFEEVMESIASVEAQLNET